jgi:TRAP transporter TAXI family solute receptor
MRKLVVAAAACALFLTGTAQAQKYNLTVAGYSPGGLVSAIGQGLDAALAAAYPGSTITYQTSSGGLANAVLLSQNKVPIAFMSTTEIAVVSKGKPPFKKPITNLRVLLSPYTGSSRFQLTHVLVNKGWADKYGIKTLADIGAKHPPMRVAVNRPGNMDGDVALATLAAVGATQDKIKSWGGQVVRAASREMTSLMLDRRIDAIVVGISYNHASVREIANGLDILMLPMTEATAEKVAEETGNKTCSVKAGEYKFLKQDTASDCVGLLLMARADMPEKEAYDITKGVFEQIDKFRSVHPLLKKAVTAQSLAEPAIVPFHPGAEKYLREKGLLK